MDMPKAPQTQSIGVIFAALGYPTRLQGSFGVLKVILGQDGSDVAFECHFR